jgi:hypothetical protein
MTALRIFLDLEQQRAASAKARAAALVLRVAATA